jgi:hypothetical protein
MGFFRFGSNALDDLSYSAGTIIGTGLSLLGVLWFGLAARHRYPTATREWDLTTALVVCLNLAIGPYFFHYDAALLWVAFPLIYLHLKVRATSPYTAPFTSPRITAAISILVFTLALGPGAAELLQKLGLRLAFHPATLALAYLCFAIQSEIRTPRHLGASKGL